MDRRMLGACGAAVLVGAAAHGDWTTGVGGNAARNGLSAEVGPVAPDLLWTGGRPAIVAQQGVALGDLFVSSRIGSFDIPTGTWIAAQDLFTGEERWATQLPHDFPGTSWRSRVSGFRDGQIYATRAGNTNLDPLYALDPADGSILWRSAALVDEGSTESVAYAPDGDVIAGNFSSLVRIDRVDGSTAWQVPRTCPTSNGCAAAAFGERVYVFEASGDGPVISVFDVETGAELYASPGFGGGFGQQVGLLVGPDGTVYAPRTQNNPATDFFVAFTDTGEALVEKWRRPLGYVPFASFAVGPDGSVYTYATEGDGGNADLTVLRLDPGTGEVLDTSPIVPSNFPVQPRLAIDAHGTVFLTNGGFSRGRLDVFRADLTALWTVNVPNVNVGGPVLGRGGVLVVCGTGTNVRAYRTPTCAGDVDGNGAVEFADLLAVLAAWGDCPGCPEDLDGDGVAGFSDLLIVLAAWGPCP